MTKLIVAFRNFANAPKNRRRRRRRRRRTATTTTTTTTTTALDMLLCTITCSTYTIVIFTYDGILGTYVLLPLSESVERRKPTVPLFQKPDTKCIFSPNSIVLLHSCVFSYACDSVTLRQWCVHWPSSNTLACVRGVPVSSLNRFTVHPVSDFSWLTLMKLFVTFSSEFSNPSLFIISPCHSALCNICVWNRVVK